MTGATAARTRRPVVGICALVIGVVHVLVAPLMAGGSLRSMLDAGVLASVEQDPALSDLRGVGFWYVTTGLVGIILGIALIVLERETGRVPVAVGWGFVGLAVWGIVLMPISPFWAFLVVAALAFHSSRRAELLRVGSDL